MNALVEAKFNVTVLSREGSTSTFPTGIDVKYVDYDSVESLTAALKGQDAVVSTLAGAALDKQTKLIDASIAAGVKRYLPSEFGSNTTDPRVVELVPPFRGKISFVDYLKSKENDISWTSVLTGPFFDWCLIAGFSGFKTATKTVTLWDNGEGIFSATNLQQVGNAVAKILQHPQETKNRYVAVSSFETSQKEILNAVEKLTGEKWAVNHLSSADLNAVGKEKLAKGDHSGMLECIQSATFGDHGYGDLRHAGLWNEKLGLEKEGFEESVKAALQGKCYGQK